MRLLITYQASEPTRRPIFALDAGMFAACSDHALAFLPRITIGRAA